MIISAVTCDGWNASAGGANVSTGAGSTVVVIAGGVGTAARVGLTVGAEVVDGAGFG